MAEGDALRQGEAGPISDAFYNAPETVERGEKAKKLAKSSGVHTLEVHNNENLRKNATEISGSVELGHSSPHKRIELSLRRIENVHKRIGRVLERHDLRSPFAERMFAFASREIQSAISAANELSGIVDSVGKVGVTSPLNAREVAKIRRMREEVEKMVAEFIAVDQSRKSQPAKERMKRALLEKHGVPKWVGKRKNGGISAHQFLNQHYGHWVRSHVIFKAEVRYMDSQLSAALDADQHRYGIADPLLTRTKSSDLLATGLFGSDKQASAAASLHRRTVRRAKVDNLA
jgi:hypothetical protein